MRTALERGASALRGRPAISSVSLQRTLAAPVLLAGFALAVAGARTWLAQGFETPWILVDELIHGELAESVATDGRFAVRGGGLTVTFLYPLLVAPAWLFDSMETTYAVAKATNALLMSFVAVPVYLWARRMVAPGRAAVAAALGLVMPSFVLTGTLMQENAALPTFVLAAFAIALALERPTALRQVAALGAVALAATARVQALILIAVFATAIVLYAALRRRPLGAELARFWPGGAALAVGAGAFLALRVDSLGVYEGVTDGDYSLPRLARWLVYSFGELSFAAGVAPVCALILLLGRRGSESEQAFLAVTTAALAWLVALAAAASSWEPLGMKERYMLYAAPLLFLALVVWIDRGLPRPRLLTVVAVALPVACLLALPLGELFGSPSFLGNAFGLFALERLPVGDGATKGVMVAGALSAGALVAFVPRRLAAPALHVALAAFLVVSSVPVYRTLTGQSERVRELAGLGEQPSWLDDAAGADRPALFLNTTTFEPDTALGRFFEAWVPVWETEFWNRSFGGVHSLGYPEPSPLRQSHGRLDWSTGRISRAPPVGRVLVDRRFELAGERIGATEHLVLYAVDEPLRLAAAAEGVYRDGTTGTLAAYDRWSAAPLLEVVVSRTVQPATATVSVGRLAVENGLPTMGTLVSRARARVEPGVEATIRLDAPPPPFRAELRLTAGGRGAHVQFRARG